MNDKYQMRTVTVDRPSDIFDIDYEGILDDDFAEFELLGGPSIWTSPDGAVNVTFFFRRLNI